MLNRFICLFAITACSFFTLNADDAKMSTQPKPVTTNTSPVTTQPKADIEDQDDDVDADVDADAKILVIMEEKRIAPGALACDASELKCTKEDILLEDAKVEVKEAAAPVNAAADCKGCPRKQPKKGELACKNCDIDEEANVLACKGKKDKKSELAACKGCPKKTKKRLLACKNCDADAVPNLVACKVKEDKTSELAGCKGCKKSRKNKSADVNSMLACKNCG
ncbi:MAG: hypothetical protein H0W88_01290 [Parachlamydiaceae bacterium]|nr:hypothetical protein [Parachlamydiaceae bacterium]